ncbi:MAG: outer membrane lipoprotein-sorting protein [Myxococcaceae bacterium]|nr:outer membrane lipoprotein-sorting protein [Myxococcaceae bacterium]
MSLLVTVALFLAADPPPDLPKCPSGEDAPDVVQLMKRTEALLEGRSSIAVMSMGMKTPSYERTVKMKLWSKGRDFALVRVLEGGPRETGMMTLKREKQLWNYLPQAGRVMKLPSGMMGDSWMGSDFTNDDLVRGSSLAQDFTSTVEKTFEHDGRKAWFVTLKPKPDAKTVWGKVELILDRASCVPLEQRFFDDEGALARRMAYSDLKQLGWRTFPMKLTMYPSENGRQTTITYESMELDVDVADDTFSLRRLQQGRE